MRVFSTGNVRMCVHELVHGMMYPLILLTGCVCPTSTTSPVVPHGQSLKYLMERLTAQHRMRNTNTLERILPSGCPNQPQPEHKGINDSQLYAECMGVYTTNTQRIWVYHCMANSWLTLNFLVAVVNNLHTKTHSSKEMTEIYFENADVKSLCYCKQRMKSTLPLSSEHVETKLCKPCTTFTSPTQVVWNGVVKDIKS